MRSVSTGGGAAGVQGASRGASRPARGIWAIVGHHLLIGAGHGEDARLRAVDDRGELLDAKHAEVGDGEGPPNELFGLELAFFGLACDGLHVGADVDDTLRVGGEDDRREETAVRVHCHRDVRRAELADVLVRPLFTGRANEHGGGWGGRAGGGWRNRSRCSTAPANCTPGPPSGPSRRP